MNPCVWLTSPFAEKLLVNEVPGRGWTVQAGRVIVSGLVPCPVLPAHLGLALCESQATALGCWRKLSYIFASQLCFGVDGSVCVQSAGLSVSCRISSPGELFLIRDDYNVPEFSC